MLRTWHRTASCLLAVLLCLFAQAQSTRRPAAPSSFSLVSIQVTGAHRFPAPDIVAASGLEVGQTASEDDFQRAMARLGSTGAFRNVMYSYQYSGPGAKLVLQVEESDQFAPAQFDNFVWFSDAELLARLHTSVPLFHGELPLSGDLAEQVSDVLQSLLVEHNISGHVDYLRQGPEDGPPSAFLYSVAGPVLRIQSILFTGVSPEEQSALEPGARPLLHQEYLRSLLLTQAEKAFLPVFLARGRLKAVIGTPETKVISQDADQTGVQVTFPVTPGPQYTLTAVTWSGNKVFPATKLQELLETSPGKVADAVLLEKNLAATEALYGTRGYVAAKVTSVPVLDDANKTVAYELRVQEGELYRMGELEIHGVDSRTTARLLEAWKLRGGEPYDTSYVKEFLYQTRDLLPNGEWSSSVHESTDAKEKVVDVTLRFDPKGTR